MSGEQTCLFKVSVIVLSQVGMVNILILDMYCDYISSVGQVMFSFAKDCTKIGHLCAQWKTNINIFETESAKKC
jgi:hypothetical protein